MKALPKAKIVSILPNKYENESKYLTKEPFSIAEFIHLSFNVFVTSG